MQQTGESGFELADLSHAQSRNQIALRDRRRQQKRERKRQWLDAQDEMRFSHNIQFNAVPDWSSHYIAYSNLKKLYVIHSLTSAPAFVVDHTVVLVLH